MYRRPTTLLWLLLLPALPAAFAQEKTRTVAEILDDHANAIGDARKVKTLKATGRRGMRTYWSLPGRCYREIPQRREKPPWLEWFSPEGAYFSKGVFDRFRPNQVSTRGGYYLLEALARPFPLLRYVGDATAQAGLKVGAARHGNKRYEVLYTAFDQHGVRAVYLIERDTHLIANVRYEAEENKPFVNLSLGDYRPVDGVMLPHATDARLRMMAPDPAKRKLMPRDGVRTQQIAQWEVNPDLGDVPFTPPGLGKGGGEGFERRTIATGPDPYDAGVGDFDGDGRLDVAVACEGALYVHFGGREEVPVRVPLGRGHHHGVAVEDLDLDGRPEVITISRVEPHQTFFFVGFDEERKPTIRSLYGAPHFAHALLSRDFDRDGIGDLLATGWASQDIHVKFGNGVGGVRRIATTWPLIASTEETKRGLGAAVGDIDRDGVDDLAVADGTRVVIFRGEMNLSFQPRIAIPDQVDPKKPKRPVDVELVDLDGDGLDDLVIAQEHPLRDLREDLIVVKNTGKSFHVLKAYDAGARVPAVASGRFEADQTRDVAAVSFLTGELVVFFGDGKGGLGEPARFVSGRGPVRLLVTDLDGDGKDDVCVTNRLDDSVTLFLNRREAPPREAGQPRATVCPPPTRTRFELKGLSHPFAFAGEFRLPKEIEDPSGLACLGSDPGQPAQLVMVSDKRSALFRLTLDRRGNRLLVGPPVPLRGLERERLDLEGIAWDPWTGNLFLGCEADSTIARASVFGNILARVPTGIPSTGNDGIEGVAFRRLADGTPLLYVFQERIGKTGQRPGYWVFGLDDAPFALKPRHADRKLPFMIADQSGATVFDGKMFVVSRLARGIAELDFQDDLFAKQAKIASYRDLVDVELGLKGKELGGLYGNVEAIAFDYDGNLYLLVDNNRETMGHAGKNRGPEGRLLWFRNKGTFQHRVSPLRVRVERLVIPAGEDAAKRAREALRRARGGADFQKLAESLTGKPPQVLRIVANEVKEIAPGEVRRMRVPVALARLAFRLEKGQIGLCEYHKIEAPEGWSIVRRVE